MTKPFQLGFSALAGRRNDAGAAKRARDGDLLLSAEADARGWSSSVPERLLALRRRRGPTAATGSFTRRGCGWVAESAAAAAVYEVHGRREAPVLTDAIGAGTVVEKKEIEPSCFSFFFHLEPAAFVTDLDSGVVFLEARNDDRTAADPADDHRGQLGGAAPPVAGRSGPASVEETEMDDPFVSAFCNCLNDF